VPYQAFPTADSHIIITIGNDQQFAQFCQVLGQPELANSENYATNSARVNNRSVLCNKIADCLKNETSKYWLTCLEENNIPCGPINNIDQVFDNPQIVARDMLIEMTNSQGVNVKLPGNPIKYSRSKIDYETMPENLGASTADILSRHDKDSY
jgi:crotonobetainyl-CoA:carnitine CoA-transferase CaiB-like acyl-CoA transferase